MAWFKKTRKPIEAPDKASRVPEGLWVKCPTCGKALYNKELTENLQVCLKCGHHFRLSAADRLRMLFDNGVWTEHDAGLRSNDPLDVPRDRFVVAGQQPGPRIDLKRSKPDQIGLFFSRARRGPPALSRRPRPPNPRAP